MKCWKHIAKTAHTTVIVGKMCIRDRTEEDRMKRFVKHKIKVLKELGVSLTTEDEKRLATVTVPMQGRAIRQNIMMLMPWRGV